MVIQYDAQELGTFRTFIRIRGTMLPMVLAAPIFWVLVVLHAVLQVLANLSSDDGSAMFVLPQLSYKAVGTVTALLTFFIVFYGGQSYSRLNMFYGHCVGIAGNVMNFTALVRNHFPSDVNVQWNATRLLLASMHIQYYTLNESDGGAGISNDEWKKIKGRNLLKRSEIELLMAYTGYKPFLPLVWALAEVEDALLPKPVDKPDASRAELEQLRKQANAERYVVSDLLSNFRELAFAFRGHCGQITNWLKQPVPFPYFHVLTVLLVIDLMLISYALVNLEGTPWYLTSLVYVICCFAFLGLREVAVAMSNPFGDDAIDFDLEAMLAGAYKNCVALLRDTRRSDGSNIEGLTNPLTNHDARFTVDVGVIPSGRAVSMAGAGDRLSLVKNAELPAVNAAL